ncbi:hypothetical protein Tco_0307057, partial [Tanacetum coccineum]
MAYDDGGGSGEWGGGSGRSKGEEYSWSSPENSAGKVFRWRRGGGGRNSRRRWWWGGGRIKGDGESESGGVSGKTEKLSGMSFHIELL